MGEFMGGVQGNRGQATRLGSKKSGIDAWIKSWEVRCSMGMRKKETGEHIIGIDVKPIYQKQIGDIVDIQVLDIDNITINGINLNELLEAHKLFNFPKELEK